MADQSAEVLQVLKGLARNREPGWNFPGNFLEVSFDAVSSDAARLSLDTPDHLLDRTSELSIAPLAVFIDIGLAAALRQTIGLATRVATVSMSVQLTGAPRRGRLESIARFDGFVADTGDRVGLVRLEIVGSAGLVATAGGTFMVLGNRANTAPLPMRRREEAPTVAPLAVGDLADDERAAYERALFAAQPGPHAFIDRFWSLEPRKKERGAVCDFVNGLHVGNRVGHVQGGISFALGALTGTAALGAGWTLVGAVASYLNPGTAPTLRAEAEVLHQGRSTAAARTRVTDTEGRTVIEALTHHARVSLPSQSNATEG